MPFDPANATHLAAHRIFTDRLALGEIAVFGNSAPEEFGLPGLGTISEFARLRRLEVAHLGMGCFSVRECGHEVLSFFGGGAMLQDSETGIAWTPLRPENGAYGVSVAEEFRSHISTLHGVLSCQQRLAQRVELAAHAEVAAFADGRW